MCQRKELHHPMDVFDKYVGQVFDNRYKIIKIIGIGGMAVVYEAFDGVAKRKVAVKMLKDEIAQDAAAVKRFINESKAVAMLSHPNIVKIYDVSVRDELKYIVMERVEGITLKNYMNKRGALTLKETLSYTEQILRALEHAHSKGIIHRDIKPQNIMLLKNGKIKVTDFGIAKLPNADTVTMTDKAIGTVYYISPEQASGMKIDARSDLYSLGVVMYEMITGRLPFNGENPVSVALMQVNTQPCPPRELIPSIPIGLEQIILGAMEKDPDHRFQNASQMLRHVIQLKNNPKFVFKTRRHDVANPRSRFTGSASGTSKKRRENTSMLPIISGVTLAFLLIIGISAVYIFTAVNKTVEENSTQTLTIPSFIGQIYSDEFLTDLEDTYYRVTVEQVYDSTVAENEIIDQKPVAGEKRKVKEGQQKCDLTLTVSLGAQTITLPDLTVMENRAVDIKLKSLGLIMQAEHEYNDTVLEGYVIRTDPAAGSVLSPGDTVTVYVSRGQEIEYTTVPNFVGLTEAKAYKELIAADLALGKVTYQKSDKAKGTVIDQSKTAYGDVPIKATKIDFVISGGPDYTGSGEKQTAAETTAAPENDSIG